MELPYYFNPETNLFIRHPWHYLLFSQFAWYRRWVGGVWRYVQPDPNSNYWTWMRMRKWTQAPVIRVDAGAKE